MAVDAKAAVAVDGDMSGRIANLSLDPVSLPLAFLPFVCFGFSMNRSLTPRMFLGCIVAFARCNGRSDAAVFCGICSCSPSYDGERDKRCSQLSRRPCGGHCCGSRHGLFDGNCTALSRSVSGVIGLQRLDQNHATQTRYHGRNGQGDTQRWQRYDTTICTAQIATRLAPWR